MVLAFAIAPSVLGFSRTPALASWALAGIHLVLTLTTRFPMGLVKIVPFTVHGALELVTSIALVVLPWLLGFAAEESARNFFIAAAVVIFTVWLITDYKGQDSVGR